MASLDLRARLKRHLAAFRKDLQALQTDWTATGVHDARVACRRLRSNLALLEVLYGTRAFADLESLLKSFLKCFNDLRDLDVQLEVLARCREEPGAADLVRERLEKRRRRQEKELRNHVLRVFAQLPLPALLERPADEAPRRRGLRAHLRKQIDGAEKLLARIPWTTPDRSAKPLHRLRIRLKRLRYELEILGEGMSSPPAVLSRFKEFQDRLGDLHDCDTLAERLSRWLAKARKKAARRWEPTSTSIGHRFPLGGGKREPRRPRREAMAEALRSLTGQVDRLRGELFARARRALTGPHLLRLLAQARALCPRLPN